MAYQPQPGTLADRVCAWFLANPEEELSASDIAQKFSVSNKSTVTPLLATSVTHRLLSREKDPVDGIYQYKAGPQIHTLREAGVRPNAPAQVAEAVAAQVPAHAECASLPQERCFPPPPKSGRARVEMPHPSQLVIEADTPMPPASTALEAGYVGVFSRMEIGHSFKCSPDAAKRLRDAANQWGKRKGNNNRKFAARRLNDTESRIWRTA